jgi:DNA topoisomerase-1
MEDGKNVYAYVAKYGPVIQIGDDKKDINYFKLDAEYNVETVSMEDLEYIMKYPCTLGQHNNNDIILKKGMYGVYLSYNGQNYKIDKEKDGEISLEEAINLINNDENGSGSKLLKKVGSYKIMNGKYGAYIEHKKKFYKIPKNKSFEMLTKEDIDNLIGVADKTKESKSKKAK